jgi:pyroglutamyl-peptidase
MLRRRRKTPKAPIVVVPELPGTTRSRRRPRGIAVPSELLVTERVSPPRAAVERARQPAKPGGVVLVTGFDAFCGEKVNPSWQVCERLPAAIAGLRVEKCRVPCEFRRAIEVVTAAIERFGPSLVICLGQAGGRAHLSIERVAINVDDARVEDNAGARPIDEPIDAHGPPAYFSTLPIKAMAQAMRAAGVPAEVSNSAGTYVCNHVMYGVLHYLATRSLSSPGAGRPRAGFIHVPYSEEQVIEKPAIAAMALATMAKGVEAAIEAAASHASDLKLGGGTLD